MTEGTRQTPELPTTGFRGVQLEGREVAVPDIELVQVFGGSLVARDRGGQEHPLMVRWTQGDLLAFLAETLNRYLGLEPHEEERSAL